MSRIAFDPARMALNSAGRAYWTDPPRGKRKGSLLAVDPATLPGAAPPEPPAPAPEESPSRMSQTPDASATRARVADPTPDSDAPPNPTARVEAGLGGVPLPKFNPPPMPNIEEVEPDPAGGAPAEPPELDASAAQQVEGPAPLAPEPKPLMVRGATDVHEMLVNSFLARFPRTYTPEERAEVEEAIRDLMIRYGGAGMTKYGELISFGMVTASAGLARLGPACEGCGWTRNPEGALFCINCGDGIATGGACVNHDGRYSTKPCPVEGIPVGTKFCPGCGTDQRQPSSPKAPEPDAPRPGHRTTPNTSPPTSAAPEPTSPPPKPTPADQPDQPKPKGGGLPQVEEVN